LLDPRTVLNDVFLLQVLKMVLNDYT